ncbi:hypothetical protein [Leptospira stimsonii]|uniref:hypothetical protein n=1 Tax=Leptospira stimsonii TaxID=2202203 RepID=UPI001314C556|nr:hypothetical protein [Leptospira stimsonii]
MPVLSHHHAPHPKAGGEGFHEKVVVSPTGGAFHRDQRFEQDPSRRGFLFHRTKR